MNTMLDHVGGVHFSGARAKPSAFGGFGMVSIPGWFVDEAGLTRQFELWPSDAFLWTVNRGQARWQ